MVLLFIVSYSLPGLDECFESLKAFQPCYEHECLEFWLSSWIKDFGVLDARLPLTWLVSRP